MEKKNNLSVLLGAAFLMATSAIGPGFMTQTAVLQKIWKQHFLCNIGISSNVF